MEVASVCIHHGEEPVISGNQGICNIFFAHCNLRCLFCQNHQISQPFAGSGYTGNLSTLDAVIEEVLSILKTGIHIVGFVSPSHMIPQMIEIQDAIHHHGFNPTWVYNSNGYDSVTTLKRLEDRVDVYLPDMKYMDRNLAWNLSDAPDYPEIAMKALKEMFRQKGSNLRINDSGYASSGILVRHLVLPGAVQNSLEVLRFLAHELSPRVHIALMSQYYPTFHAVDLPEMNRSLHPEEYEQVVNEMERLGLDRGFIQNLESFNHYRPDFNQNHPFEKD